MEISVYLKQINKKNNLIIRTSRLRNSIAHKLKLGQKLKTHNINQQLTTEVAKAITAERIFSIK